MSNTIDASEALGVDSEFRKKVAAMRDRLLGPKIGKWGQLQEWAEDLDDPKEQHRHLSHLIAVHPGRQISPLTTPKLAEAAKLIGEFIKGNVYNNLRSSCPPFQIDANFGYAAGVSEMLVQSHIEDNAEPGYLKNGNTPVQEPGYVLHLLPTLAESLA